MKPHKWAKEIKAWADGAEIETFDITIQEWIVTPTPQWYENYNYRIKSQLKEIHIWDDEAVEEIPKEPQYLYVYNVNGEIKMCEAGGIIKVPNGKQSIREVGKIKLEQE